MRLRPLALSAWKRLRTRIHYIRTFLYPDVVLLQGITAEGTSIAILRGGNTDRQAAYFLSGQVLAELCDERSLGRTWIWLLPSLARKHACAFVLLRVSTSKAALGRWLLRGTGNNSLHLPVYVRATADVSDIQKLLRSESLRSDVRRTKNHGFTFSISRNKQELKTFVRDFHDPYVRKIHGFDAIEMDFQRLIASCSGDEIPEPWQLLKVNLDGEWVAGMLLLSETGWAALMELGVKNADLALVKRGALQAAYWLSIEYLRGQGHTRVSFMHARPFLRSGVLQYKLKYGPTLEIARPDDGYLLLFEQGNVAARETLLRESFLVYKGDGLGAVWFSIDSSAPPDPACISLDRLAQAGVTDVERVVLPEPPVLPS